MAKILNYYPTYIAMLHGHANPVTFTDGEKGDLIKLSNDRANAVKLALLNEYDKLTPNPANPPFNDRVSTSGYGGEKVLFGDNSSYTPLNRRVELILFEIVTTVE
jgi:outer membrane protein OmpA-like peptidoglycan-associated protein